MRKNLILLTVIAAALILCPGCKKKSKEKTQNDSEIFQLKQKGDHSWFYFTQDGFIQVDNPKNVPLSKTQPYTEAIRISSANNTGASSTGKAYALVNRLGVLCFEGNNISIAKDISVFSDTCFSDFRKFYIKRPFRLVI